MPYKMLVTEDSSQIREMIGDYFAAKDKEMFSIDFAQDGETALEKLYENEYDLVLLDIMLPGASGFEICKHLPWAARAIFFTAMNSEQMIISSNLSRLLHFTLSVWLS